MTGVKMLMWLAAASFGVLGLCTLFGGIIAWVFSDFSDVFARSLVVSLILFIVSFVFIFWLKEYKE